MIVEIHIPDADRLGHERCVELFEKVRLRAESAASEELVDDGFVAYWVPDSEPAPAGRWSGYSPEALRIVRASLRVLP